MHKHEAYKAKFVQAATNINMSNLYHFPSLSLKAVGLKNSAELRRFSQRSVSIQQREKEEEQEGRNEGVKGGKVRKQERKEKGIRGGGGERGRGGKHERRNIKGV